MRHVKKPARKAAVKKARSNRKAARSMPRIYKDSERKRAIKSAKSRVKQAKKLKK